MEAFELPMSIHALHRFKFFREEVEYAAVAIPLESPLVELLQQRLALCDGESAFLRERVEAEDRVAEALVVERAVEHVASRLNEASE